MQGLKKLTKDKISPSTQPSSTRDVGSRLSQAIRTNVELNFRRRLPVSLQFGVLLPRFCLLLLKQKQKIEWILTLCMLVRLSEDCFPSSANRLANLLRNANAETTTGILHRL